jgi:hypothetical protein
MFKVTINGEELAVQGIPELQQWLKSGRVQQDTPVLDLSDGNWKTVAVILRPPSAVPSPPPPPAAEAVVPKTQKSSKIAKFFWILTMIGSVIGGFIVITGVANASGAPQEASAAAIGVAFAVIPYCFARAVSEA